MRTIGRVFSQHGVKRWPYIGGLCDVAEAQVFQMRVGVYRTMFRIRNPVGRQVYDLLLRKEVR